MIYQKEKLFDLIVDKSSMKYIMKRCPGSSDYRNMILKYSSSITISLTLICCSRTLKNSSISISMSSTVQSCLRFSQPTLTLTMKMRLVEWTSNSNWVLCPFHKNGPAVIWTDRVGCKKSFKKGNCREENWWTRVDF